MATSRTSCAPRGATPRIDTDETRRDGTGGRRVGTRGAGETSELGSPWMTGTDPTGTCADGVTRRAGIRGTSRSVEPAGAISERAMTSGLSGSES